MTEKDTPLKNRKNKLSKEKSPYLRSHANNPVDWEPWGDEALDRAVREDKPLFISIGYSACRWCHVMERESFEDEDIAQILNENFVGIKVDREERPDVDSNYMTVCQMMTGSGGWPLTIIAAPDGKPFFAGTYFPKESRDGAAGLIEILNRVVELWNTKRDKIADAARDITEKVAQASTVKPGNSGLDPAIVDKCFRELETSFDKINGGFGGEPKFPIPHNYLFLFRYAYAKGGDSAKEIALKSLEKMRLGGVYDQIGGGFHRYSTDARWLVPHFEKMLYDQALLIAAYSEAYKISGDEFFSSVARETADYVLRDLRAKEGGFYSAEDAESEGEEGKFYVWTWDELQSEFGDETEKLAKIYNFEKNGNYYEEVGGKSGANILHLEGRFSEISDKTGIPLEEIEKLDRKFKNRLFELRKKRIRPALDDKILADWNGLAIAALAKASVELDDKIYLNAAKDAADFLIKTMSFGSELKHRYCDGELAVDGMIDDYAFAAWGMFELHQASLEVDYLEKSIVYCRTAVEKFWDPAGGGFFISPESEKRLLLRKKEIYDGATPSGNSIMFLNMIRIERLTGSGEFTEHIEKPEKAFSSRISAAPSVYTGFLSAYLTGAAPSKEIAIVSDEPDTSDYLRLIRKKYEPGKAVLLKNSDNSEKINKLAPFAREMKLAGGKTTIYVCENYVCNRPAENLEELRNLL